MEGGITTLRWIREDYATMKAKAAETRKLVENTLEEETMENGAAQAKSQGGQNIDGAFHKTGRVPGK